MTMEILKGQFTQKWKTLPFTHPNLLFLPTLCDFLSSQKEIIVIIHFHYIE